MVITIAAACGLRVFGLALKPNQAERAFDTSAENFSICCVISHRPRWRECALGALAFGLGDSDGTGQTTGTPTVSEPDSDGAALWRAVNESVAPKNTFLS